MKDGYFHSRLTSSGNDLTCTLESLLHITKALAGFEAPTSDAGTALRRVALELQGYCTQIKNRLASLNDDTDSTSKLLDLERNIMETKNVERLTILLLFSFPCQLLLECLVCNRGSII